MNRFLNAIHSRNEGPPPVWFMRQAGRYHAHYQALKKRHSFIELCKNPDLASEVTKGPIEDFDFDAAILFSDLLFPLEALGMGLRYDPGPKLGWRLSELSDLKKLASGGEALVERVSFQGEALRKIRTWLPDEKGLIGFVGSPLTLFFYAVEGSHQAGNESGIPEKERALAGLRDGRFKGFQEHLAPLLAANLSLQAASGADVIAIFDTCGGEIRAADFAQIAWPALEEVLVKFRKEHPLTPLIYYSRGTGPEHWASVNPSLIRCLGIDWRTPIDEALTTLTPRFALQGNFDPSFLHLPPKEFAVKFDEYVACAKRAPKFTRRAWISGLGHGVLQQTPEENVRAFVKRFREEFA